MLIYAEKYGFYPWIRILRIVFDEWLIATTTITI